MSLNSIVATALSRGWLSIATALLMTTRNPGKILGDERQIVPGAKADLISFSWTPGDLKLGVRNVIASGRSLLLVSLDPAFREAAP